MINHKSSIINRKSQFGFTLIELIVVLSVAAVISVVGIAAFVLYSQTQSLNTAAGDIANMFSLAKSRANSQVKPSSCSTQTLNGYQISIIITSKTYKLYAICSSGNYLVLTSTLPSNITFSNPTDATFFFIVLTGGFTKSSDTISLSGFGKSKNIAVDSLGNLQIN